MLKTRMKLGAGLLVLVFLATACDNLNMQVGESQTRTHEPVVTFKQVDIHTVDAFSNGTQTERYNCPDGIAAPFLNGNTLRVDCTTQNLTETEEVIPETMAEVQTTAPTSGSVDGQAQPMSAQQSTTWCGGGKGWVGHVQYADYMGKLPNEPGDDLNWRVKGDPIVWCVQGGTVQCGLTFNDSADLRRGFRQSGETDGPAGRITPCGIWYRQMQVTWHLIWDPLSCSVWCKYVDVDLNMAVDIYGHYWGKWKHNGDGI